MVACTDPNIHVTLFVNRFAVLSTLELPHKTYIYALLLASVHVQSEAVAHRLLSALHARLDAAMADTSSGLGWRALKMTVRLYAELIKLGVCPTSVLSDAYTSFVHILADPSSSEERKDCAALMLLSTLPWAAGALPVDGGVADAPGMDLAQVFTAVRQYVQVERQLRQQAAAACTPFRTNCPYEQRDELTLLLDQVQDLAGSGWKVRR